MSYPGYVAIPNGAHKTTDPQVEILRQHATAHALRLQRRGTALELWLQIVALLLSDYYELQV